MARRKKSGDAPHPLVAVFATFLVVGGVAGVVYLISQPQILHAPSGTGQMIQQATSTTMAASSTPIVLVNETSATVIDASGISHREALSAFSARAALLGVSPIGADAGTGEKAYSPFLLTSTSSASNSIPSPSGTYRARMAAATGDEASVIELARAGEDAQRLVLRSDGQAMHDATLYGWTTDDRMLVVGTLAGKRSAFSVSPTGTVTLLAPIPDEAIAMDARLGSIWYITAQPGPGLESPPTGPSELHQIPSSAKSGPPDILFTTCAGTCVIQSFIASDDAAHGLSVVYQTDTEQMVYVNGDMQKNLGKGRPLLMLPDGQMLARRGYNLVRIDPVSGTVTDLGALPEGHVEVYLLSRYTAPGV